MTDQGTSDRVAPTATERVTAFLDALEARRVANNMWADTPIARAADSGIIFTLTPGDLREMLAGQTAATVNELTVEAERARQIEKGYTAEHDDKQGIDHLLLWALHYAKKGEHVKSAALVEAARGVNERATRVREEVAL